MANETKIAQLVIDLKIKTEALEQGINTAKTKLKELEDENEEIKSKNKETENSYLALAAVATASFYGIITIIKSSVAEYNNYTQAMSSLNDVADYTKQNMSEFADIMNEFSKYMTKSDIAATIKNFSLMGMTASETKQMMEALTNSAIKNRNTNYTVSEAVKVASDGYKQGLSTLSDSAGVTENLSVMLDKYAQSIGKTASQLTAEEQNQAYLNRTMEAAAPFASAMNEYTDSLAGKQGELSNALKETQTTYASALQPTLTSIIGTVTQLLNNINGFISQHKTLTTGLTTFAVTLTGVTVAIVALKKGYEVFNIATIASTVATKGFTAALMANPIFLIATAIATAVAGISMLCSAINDNAEAQQKLNEKTQEYQAIKEGKYLYTDENIKNAQESKTAIEKQLDLLKQEIEYQKTISEYEQQQAEKNQDTVNTGIIEVTKKEYKDAKESLKALQKQYDEAIKTDGKMGDSIENLESKLKSYNSYLSNADSLSKINNAINIDSVKTKQKEAAQLKINVQQMQGYLNTVKAGKTSTTEYQNAVAALAKAYPEAANAQGIIIDKAQDYINSQGLQADAAWNASQTTIQGNIAVVQSFIQMAQAAANDTNMQAELASAIGIDYNNIIPTLTSVLNILQAIGGQQPTEVSGITPTSVTTPKASKSSSGSSSYENKKLDNYKKEIEYKKSLDQLSTQDEINMYQYALDHYAKTTDEKRELRTKLYELNKELAKAEKDIVDQETKNIERAMEDQKNARGAAYDVNEQKSDYDKIISIHKQYLDQVMKDTRLSYDERKEIYQDELDSIRDYEKQKRDLMVSSVDDTVSQLTDAIKAQLEDMQKADENAINADLKKVDEWKTARINAINAEYDARLEEIQKELDLLDKSEQNKTREQEDAQYNEKKARLQNLIDYEHDATNKANYQIEMDKLVADYKKTLDSRALQDKKDALEQQKDLVKNEQDSKVKAIEDEASKQTETLNNQLTNINDYYEKQSDQAEKTAQKMLLNVENNQEQILTLLKNYGNEYEITGQSIGEKLAQGINNGVLNKISNLVQTIQDTIDTTIENKIASMSSGVYKYQAGVNKPTASNSINVNQTNYIQQEQEMPSETYRKLNNVSESLAAELAGI